MATGTDINARYGAHLAIGKVCLALKSNSVPISEETLTDITQIEPKVTKVLHFCFNPSPSKNYVRMTVNCMILFVVVFS